MAGWPREKQMCRNCARTTKVVYLPGEGSDILSCEPNIHDPEVMARNAYYHGWTQTETEEEMRRALAIREATRWFAEGRRASPDTIRAYARSLVARVWIEANNADA